jgi:lipoprotein NlpD
VKTDSSVLHCAPLLLAMLLAACASTGPAPVEDRSPGVHGSGAERPPAPRASAAPYRVQRGDTLYSIAFRNGLDYRELAEWNRIGPPYTIYVGQELRLTGATATDRSAHAMPRPVPARVEPAPHPASAPRGSLATAARPAPFGPLEATPAAPAATTPPSASPARPLAAPPPPTASTPVSTAPAATATSSPAATPPPAPAAPAGDIAWRWPADGTVVGTFASGDPTRQGIDIAGKAGNPVRAAAAGTVVYSGNGLIGYGELIIVKHSPAFLSAYGHNRKRLVKEGDHVDAGQVIAEMGSSSASRDSLHFEIRRNGKPADPTDYLPRR